MVGRAIILLPVHRYANGENLHISIESVTQAFDAYNGTRRKVLCIAVDDGDRGLARNLKAKYLEDLASSDIGLIAFVNFGAKGLQHNLNQAIRRLRLVSDDLVLRLDCDDYVSCERVVEQVAAMEADKHIDLIFSKVKINRMGNIIVKPKKEFVKLRLEDLILKNQIAHSSVCFRGKTFEKFGLYDEQCKFGQDFEMWLRILANGGNIVMQSKPLVVISQGKDIYSKRLKAQKYYQRALLKWWRWKPKWFARLILILLFRFANTVFFLTTALIKRVT